MSKSGVGVSPSEKGLETLLMRFGAMIGSGEGMSKLVG